MINNDQNIFPLLTILQILTTSSLDAVKGYCVEKMMMGTSCAIHSTKISGNFGPKLSGSVYYGLPISNTICVLLNVDGNNTRFYYAQKT